MNVGMSYVIFIVAAFLLGFVIITKRDSIPDKLRRPLAIAALIMVVLAFILILYSMVSLGS
ncbi:hypothetical protein PUW24_16525 [Paenibacillus urinalis]|uniref:Signal transduction histidine kinase n=1 Tax=Paenibacillus urinalis TaxID=521520 RepID=A0AAX3N6G6_9BACL|nr:MULTISPECIES: hypothetical protein [Paenibacillus]WDH84330.1 hypothetical protein PUW23_09020 [Paenibacillus urinalis]WDH95799.1 hypothetical protein PUW24_16525 [Paenibacillus urinalis]WDI04014.1 hypothetical protein PUW25_08715 [Paenibacillus urinalis]GAK38677.1 dipeptide ABC transporter permease protein [Paenibacillus sp. TCA20]